MTRFSHMPRRRGATVVEFALIMVVFLNFAVGAVELMIMFSAWSTLQWACDIAARQTMVASSPTVATATSVAQTTASSVGYTPGSGISFSDTSKDACVPGGQTQCIIIRGTYVYTFKLSTMGLLTVTLRSQASAPLV